MTSASFTLTPAPGWDHLGKLRTAHGVVETPAYVPLATGGAVGSLRPAELRALGAQAIAVSLYGLLQRPGAKVIESLGGLHAFLGWDGPLLTDPGDRELESLAEPVGAGSGRRARGMAARVVSAGREQVVFTSYVDGSRQVLSPAGSIYDQRRLGADVGRSPAPALEFGSGAERPAAEWACRAAEAAGDFPLVLTLNSDASETELTGVLGWAVRAHRRYPILDEREGLPRLLLVLGDDGPPSFLQAVACGADLVQGDSAIRAAEAGLAFSSVGRVSVREPACVESVEAPDAHCRCSVCSFATRGYLHHLFEADEMAGPTMLAHHNLAFMLSLERDVRDWMRAGEFAAAAASFLTDYGLGGGEGP